MSYSTTALICYGILLKDDQYDKWCDTIDEANKRGLELEMIGDDGESSHVLCIKKTIVKADYSKLLDLEWFSKFAPERAESDANLRDFLEKYNLATDGEIGWILGWCTV